MQTVLTRLLRHLLICMVHAHPEDSEHPPRSSASDSESIASEHPHESDDAEVPSEPEQHVPGPGPGPDSGGGGDNGGSGSDDLVSSDTGSAQFRPPDRACTLKAPQA